MSLLADILQQQQQISQNPTSVVRTPQQIAYDNLLNREDEINRKNKTNNLVSGLMSGIGGLGKIIASSVVKQPMQQAGAMKGISEQEQRLDALQQAYNQAREQQNKDYVNQAREQLGLAREDDDKTFNRDLTTQQIAYKKAQDEITNKLNQEKFDFAKEQAEKAEIQRAIDNKWKEIEDINKREATEQAKLNAETDRAYKQAQIDKINYENSPEYRKQVEEQEKEKIRQDQLKKNQERVFTLINNNSIEPNLGNLLLQKPELMEYLKDSGKYSKPFKIFGTNVPFMGGSDNKFTFDFERFLTDNGKPATKENIKALKKQLGL